MRAIVNGALIGAALSLGIWGLSKTRLASGPAPTALSAQEPRSSVTPVPGAPESFADLCEQVRPSVVAIHATELERARAGRSGGLMRSAAVPRTRTGSGVGTGFVVDPNGLILTNTHVLERASGVRVRFMDGHVQAAEIVGVDALTDLAVLRTEPRPNMSWLPLGDSDIARVGDWVLAVGNPFGLQSSVSAGIISARDRKDVPVGEDVRYVDFLQTDASLNPGNSGGPLVNMRGEVVGVNTAISRGGAGIGFAIPSNMAAEIYRPLVEEGVVTRSSLGATVDDLNAEAVRALGLSNAKGVLVTECSDEGPAAAGGIEPGDVIVRFGGEDVMNTAELQWEVSMAGVGARVAVDVVRDGSEMRLHVVLGALEL